MIERYKKELTELKDRMKKAESFAKKIPLFEEIILERKLTGDEEHIYFSDSYRGMPLRWGVRRALFKKGSNRIMTNYEFHTDQSHPESIYLFYIYVNTVNLFDSHEKFGLSEITKRVDVFYFDKCNSGFYIKDNHIEPFLEALNEWYKKARKEVVDHRVRLEIEETERKLQKLKQKAKIKKEGER